MDTQTLLEKVSQKVLDSSSSEQMIRLACAYWHEGFIPDTEKIKMLGEEPQHRAGYLTEFFAAFNCLDSANRKQLIAAAERIRSFKQPRANTDNPDDIAVGWGLDDNINAFLKDILYYQTRHYRHEKDD